MNLISPLILLLFVVKCSCEEYFKLGTVDNSIILLSVDGCFSEFVLLILAAILFYYNKITRTSYYTCLILFGPSAMAFLLYCIRSLWSCDVYDDSCIFFIFIFIP